MFLYLPGNVPVPFFSSSVWAIKCFFRLSDLQNDLIHKEQLKGFSPVCTLMCCFRRSILLNTLEHWEHLWGFFSVELTSWSLESNKGFMLRAVLLDTHHFDADPYLDFHFDPDPDPNPRVPFTLIRTILLLIWCGSGSYHLLFPRFEPSNAPE